MDDSYQVPIARLRALHAELIESLATVPSDANPVELDQARVGRLTRMDAIAQAEMTKATQARVHTQLRRVVAALERVKSGTYGRCCQCREAIDPARLDGDPATPFCLTCLEDMAETRARGTRRD